MIPKDFNDLSVEFFSSILSIPVASFNLDPEIVIKQGNTSLVHVVIVNFCNPLTFPSRRLFLKFALPLEDSTNRNVSLSRQTFIDAGVYRKEVEFYRCIRQIACDLVPQIYYAEIEEIGNSEHFLIVMGEGGEPLNQLRGCSLDTSRSVMSQAARLHSLNLNGDFTATLNPSHLIICQIVYGPGDHRDKSPESLLDFCLNNFEAKFDDLSFVVQATGWIDSESIRVLKERFANKRILRELQIVFNLSFIESDFRSIVHGDFRLDNMLLDPETGNVRFIDFQAVHYGHPAYDLAQFLVQCHNYDAQLFDELLTIYYNTLMERLPHLTLTLESLMTAVKSAFLFQLLLISFHLAPLKAAIDPETGKLPPSMDPFMELIQIITKRAIQAALNM